MTGPTLPQRRRLLRQMALAPAVFGAPSLLAGLGTPAASGGDYRALLVLFLNGGNDGHNCLVPTDSAYGDYQRARRELALRQSSLVPLAGSSAGHTFGVNPALAPLAPLYDAGRLAWIVNAGPLIVPATARQVLDASVEVPPHLLSHSDQVAIQQGWGAADDASGWAGRLLEELPASLRHPRAACTFSTHRTLVQGRRTPVSEVSVDPDGLRYWGRVDVADPAELWTRELTRLAQLQSANAYAAEYGRTIGAALTDAAALTEAFAAGTAPSADFGSGSLADALRTMATLLPGFKSLGYRRQVFLLNWGQFDTHANQRGSAQWTQDAQLTVMARALAAFDAANRASGVDGDVATLVMSDFGRTLRPVSGGGSDHAWGNHWWALGGPVIGRQVVGTFPTLTLGGPDDADHGRGGHFVPTTATDQVAATFAQWLGLPADRFATVFPLLANFARPTLVLLHG